DAWRTDFAGCPGADGEAGLIVGTLTLSIDPSNTANPGVLWPYARATLVKQGTQDDPVQARYLKNLTPPGEGPIDGPATYDPEAPYAGSTGRFAFFGVQGGPWTLTLMRCVDYTATSCGDTMLGRSTVFVPDGGVVQREPALVPF